MPILISRQRRSSTPGSPPQALKRELMNLNNQCRLVFKLGLKSLDRVAIKQTEDGACLKVHQSHMLFLSL